MREFKFRAWLKQEQKMMRVNTIFFNVQYGMGQGDRVNLVDLEGKSRAYAVGEDVELMQSTGLLDCKGCEIYEGDVLSYPGLALERVYWNCGAFKTFDGEFHCHMEESDLDIAQVIGNIWQNPAYLETLTLPDEGAHKGEKP